MIITIFSSPKCIILEQNRRKNIALHYLWNIFRSCKYPKNYDFREKLGNIDFSFNIFLCINTLQEKSSEFVYYFPKKELTRKSF